MTAVGLVLAGTFIAAAIVVAIAVHNTATEPDHWADLHDLFDDNGEAYDPEDAR